MDTFNLHERELAKLREIEDELLSIPREWREEDYGWGYCNLAPDDVMWLVKLTQSLVKYGG